MDSSEKKPVDAVAGLVDAEMFDYIAEKYASVEHHIELDDRTEGFFNCLGREAVCIRFERKLNVRDMRLVVVLILKALQNFKNTDRPSSLDVFPLDIKEIGVW
jgi:hypothetical protein